MAANGSTSVEDTEMTECDGEKVVTMMDVLQEQQEFEEDANAVLGASDDKNCTYSKGYIKRQAIYACLTCCAEARHDETKRAGVCLACSLNCHENHELIELYTKRNFRCDCGNPKFNSHPCQFTPNKIELNNDNKYNQNFIGIYCICHKPYPDPEGEENDEEMIQCIICEDWLHASHLEAIVPPNDQYSEMICKACMDNNTFLHDYSNFTVNVETDNVDVTTPIGNDSICNGINSNGISEEPVLSDKDITDKTDIIIAQVESRALEGDTNKQESTEDLDCDKVINNDSKQNNDEPMDTKTDGELIENSNETMKQNSDSEIPENKASDNTEVVKEILQTDKSETEELNESGPPKSNENEEIFEASEPLPNTENITDKEKSEITEMDETKTLEIECGNNQTSETDKTKTPEVESDHIENSKTEIQKTEAIESTEQDSMPDTIVETNKSNEITAEASTTVTSDDNNYVAEKTDESIDNNVLMTDSADQIVKDDTTEKPDIEKTNNDAITTNNDLSIKDSGDKNTEDIILPQKNTELTTHNSTTFDVNGTNENTIDETKINVEDGNTSKEIQSQTNPVEKRKLSTEEMTDNTSDEIKINGDGEGDSLEENPSKYPLEKRKLCTDEITDESTIKKPKLDNKCIRPKGVKRIHKGATFWPSSFRQKLCTCNECLSMYKDLSLLFLIDPEDTVFAYETLGKEKIDGGPVTQYEKGLEALSSLGRIQQINALTEYNKMRDKLLDFLKSFKERKEVVKEDDIKAFFAGMKPKREPDGVYFCR